MSILENDDLGFNNSIQGLAELEERRRALAAKREADERAEAELAMLQNNERLSLAVEVPQDILNHLTTLAAHYSLLVDEGALTKAPTPIGSGHIIGGNLCVADGQVMKVEGWDYKKVKIDSGWEAAAYYLGPQFALLGGAAIVTGWVGATVVFTVLCAVNTCVTIFDQVGPVTRWGMGVVQKGKNICLRALGRTRIVPVTRIGEIDEAIGLLAEEVRKGEREMAKIEQLRAHRATEREREIAAAKERQDLGERLVLDGMRRRIESALPTQDGGRLSAPSRNGNGDSGVAPTKRGNGARSR